METGYLCVTAQRARPNADPSFTHLSRRSWWSPKSPPPRSWTWRVHPGLGSPPSRPHAPSRRGASWARSPSPPSGWGGWCWVCPASVTGSECVSSPPPTNPHPPVCLHPSGWAHKTRSSGWCSGFRCPVPVCSGWRWGWTQNKALRITSFSSSVIITAVPTDTRAG